jgi:hypothetical protein
MQRSGDKSPRFAGEHAHPECAVEWWFYQGYYEGPASGRRYFMTTLFRSNLEVRDGGPSNGFQLMLAVLDPNSAREGHESMTWIDPTLLGKAIEKLKTTDPHVDPVVQRAFTREIEEHGPPYPILLQPVPEVFEAGPLRVEWRGLSLSEETTGFGMKFREPDSGRFAPLHMAAAASRMEVACGSEAVPLGTGMAYHAYPRVRLRGHLDTGEKLVGQAWMDH